MESQITLSGYVGSDVEFSSGDGWSAARFRLGCTPSWRKGSEWVNGETTWWTIRVNGLMAVNVRDSVHKGDPLLVAGRVRTRVWDDAQGEHRQQVVVEAQALGHDIAKGVSSFVRAVRASARELDEPLGPDNPVVVAPEDAPLDGPVDEPEGED